MAEHRRRPPPDRRAQRKADRRDQCRAGTPGERQRQVEQQCRRHARQHRRPARHREAQPQPEEARHVGCARNLRDARSTLTGDRVRHRHRRQRHQRHPRRLVEIDVTAEFGLVDRQRGEFVDRRIAILDQADRGEQPRRLVRIALPRPEPGAGKPDQQADDGRDAAGGNAGLHEAVMDASTASVMLNLFQRPCGTAASIRPIRCLYAEPSSERRAQGAARACAARAWLVARLIRDCCAKQPLAPPTPTFEQLPIVLLPSPAASVPCAWRAQLWFSGVT